MEPPQSPKPRSAVGTEIIESILVAAELVIEEVSLEKLTTNRIAERAGVSVGSLYQYFPNKHAVLAELARRLERRTQDRLVAILRDATSSSLPLVAASIVDAMLDDLGGLALRRALLQEVPRLWIASVSQQVDAELRVAVHDVLAARTDVRSGDHVLIAWVVSHAVEGVIEAAVRTGPELVDAPEFRAELIELVVRYLS